ncbi:MAG: LysR substrate-binding domain-containing protein [Lachnospiraceae bacterium]
MDLNSLIYFTEAAKDLNFTQTARRLYISQQNLSNHIARLEEYYDVKLFERKPHLALTYAGEVLLAYASNFKMEEDNLKNVLGDIKKKEKGVLHIGGSPSRTSIVMPVLAERFAQKYPNVELNFYHHHSSTLTKMLLDGELDFSIGIDKVRHPNIIAEPLFTDRIYVMVSDKILRKYLPEKADQLIESAEHGHDISEFADIPFVNIRSSNIAKDCFLCAGIEPKFTITSNYPQLFLPDNYENTAASIITKTVYLHIYKRISKETHIFPINTRENFLLNEISFIRHKRKYLSQYGQYFLKITEEYFSELDEMQTTV